MRLVDADEFKKQIAGMAIVNNYPADKANKMCELIDCQPTAYDVDKVVERLKKVNEDDNICEKFIKNDRKRCKNARGCFDCAIRESIEIVKSGGVE